MLRLLLLLQCNAPTYLSLSSQHLNAGKYIWGILWLFRCVTNIINPAVYLSHMLSDKLVFVCTAACPSFSCYIMPNSETLLNQYWLWFCVARSNLAFISKRKKKCQRNFADVCWRLKVCDWRWFGGKRGECNLSSMLLCPLGLSSSGLRSEFWGEGN